MRMETDNYNMHGTTIVAVNRDGRVAIGGDGQVTLGNSVMKNTARKVIRLAGGKVAAGFAGSVADAMTLLERFETKLDEHNKNLARAATELARDWRMDKYLRRLEAMLIVADKSQILLISGNGEVIEPENSVAAIGSGGVPALAAAAALIKNTDLKSEEVVREALTAASSVCIYTNTNFTIEVIE